MPASAAPVRAAFELSAGVIRARSSIARSTTSRGRPPLFERAVGAVAPRPERRGQLFQRRDDGCHVAGRKRSRRQLPRDGQQGQRLIQRGALLLLANAAQPLLFGNGRIEPVALTFPVDEAPRLIAGSRRAGQCPEQRIVDVVGTRNGGPKRLLYPARDAAGVPPILIERHTRQTDHQRFGGGGVERPHSRQPRDQRQGSLELPQRDERPIAIERRQLLRPPRRRGIDKCAPHAHLLDRQHQHAVAREGADRRQDVAGGGSIGPAECPLAERELIEPLASGSRVPGCDRFSEPGGIDRTIVNQRLGVRRGRRQFAPVERPAPPRSHRGERRRPVQTHLDARQHRADIVERPGERQPRGLPLRERGPVHQGQGLEPLHPYGGILDPQAERERRPRCIHLRDGIVEIREASFVLTVEQADERCRPIQFFADHRFPQRRRVGAAGRNHPVRVNAQAAAESGVDRRIVLVQAREHRRVIGQILQRLVVERRETMAEMRRTGIRQDRSDDRLRRNRATEDGARPDIGGQRDWYRIGRLTGSALLDGPAPQRGGRSGARGRRAFRRWVREPRELGHEAGALGRRRDAQRMRHRHRPAGDRHVLRDASGRAEDESEKIPLQSWRK